MSGSGTPFIKMEDTSDNYYYNTSNNSNSQQLQQRGQQQQYQQQGDSSFINNSGINSAISSPITSAANTSNVTNVLSPELLSYASPSFGPNMSGNELGGANYGGAYLDESDLLDLDAVNSPDINNSMNNITSNNNAQIPPLYNSNSNNNSNNDPNSLANAAAASIGFSTTPSQPIIGSPSILNNKYNNNSGFYGQQTPQISESTSPFDEFMLNQNMKKPQIQQQQQLPSNPSSPSIQNASIPQKALWFKQRQLQLQQQQQQQQQQQSSIAGSPSQYGMTQITPSSPQLVKQQINSPPGGPGDLRPTFSSPPHALRFLHDNGIGSGTSSPVGSVGSYADFGLSPSAKPPILAHTPTNNTNGGLIPNKGTSKKVSGKKNMMGGTSSSLLNQSSTAGLSSPVGATSKSLNEDSSSLLAERRRRRRESHNAVERRRRDNINEKIQELAFLVPDELLYSTTPTSLTGEPITSPGGTSNQPSLTLTKDGKPNKGTILTKSVEYIRHLQTIIDEQNSKELEMQDMVHHLQRQLGVELTVFTHTSAEILLAKLRGVPLPGSTGSNNNNNTSSFGILGGGNDNNTTTTNNNNSSSNKNQNLDDDMDPEDPTGLMLNFADSLDDDGENLQLSGPGPIHLRDQNNQQQQQQQQQQMLSPSSGSGGGGGYTPSSDYNTSSNNVMLTDYDQANEQYLIS